MKSTKEMENIKEALKDFTTDQLITEILQRDHENMIEERRKDS